MRALTSLFIATLAAGPAAAEQISSQYTEYDVAKDCATVDASAEGEGDYAAYACHGWRGFPVLAADADLRESAYYGFPNSAAKPAWESFGGFNGLGSKIEWRIASEGDRTIPFATIRRSFVSADGGDAEQKTEVLVVSKVGQVGGDAGCVVGLVVASGNPRANETARKIADEQARDFACGADERVQVPGEQPVPEFSRSEN